MLEDFLYSLWIFNAGNNLYLAPATPSGKVELKSSVLEALGFDPLPYYREGPAISEDYTYYVFTGVREDAFFQTGQRQVKVLRDRMPSPKLFMHPDDAE